MNREQRRREAAAHRGDPVELRLYDRAGKLFATHYRSLEQPVDGQIRLCPASAGFRSVAEAEAAGRVDLVRCFLLDPKAGGGRRLRIYREAEGGHDRMPEQTAGFEYQTLDLAGAAAAFPQVVALGNRLLERFPAGTLWPFESYVLAFVRLHLGDDWERPDRVDPAAVSAAVQDFIERSGYSALWTRAQIASSLARMPELSAQAAALGCWTEAPPA